MKRFVNQWCVYNVDLGEPNGSVQGGVRPCLIVQNAIGNSYSPTTVCVPITHQQNKSNIPPHYTLYKSEYPFFNYNTNVLLCEQIVTIDVHNQVLQYMGKIKDNDKEPILNTINKNFILKDERSK
jgi:mRNA interferase MazF